MKLNSIQFLRAVAALLVVYEHSMDVQMRYGRSWQQSFFHLNNFGCIGVDMFFVISGFIITLIANKYAGASQGFHFLKKRFYRINPVYYIVTLLDLAILFLIIDPHPLSGSPYLSFNSIRDSLFIFPVGSDPYTYKTLLVVAWTLGFEWLFYLLFFLLIICNIKEKVFSLIGIITLLVVSGYIFKLNDFRLIFMTNPIILEFLLGCIISYIYLTVKQIPADTGFICLLIGLAGYVFLIIQGFGNIDNYEIILTGRLSLPRFFLWGIPSSLIVAGCVFLEKNGQFSRLWGNRFALLCGNASYSIYLVHVVLFYLLMHLYDKTRFFLAGDLMIWLQLIIVVAVAILFYKLVEKPLLKLLNKTK